RNDQLGFVRNFRRRYSILFRNQFRLGSKLGFNLSWRYNSPESSFYYTRVFNQKWDMGLSYKLLQNRVNLSFRLTDILNSLVREGLNSGEGFQQFFITNPRSRVAYLSFSYLFGKNDLKKRNKKSRRYESGIID
ncbi:MAG: outer membrane beta-barrel protein, partial [Bacteroidota bacterium]